MVAQGLTVAEFQARIGSQLAVSDWLRLEQDRIDRFADAVGDHQFIHVEPERARKETPFGGTIAHGFLSLSLLSKFADDSLPPLAGRVMGINYGFEKVRFLAPVRAGERVRGRFVLADAFLRAPDQLRLDYDVRVEIEGREALALAARWLTLAIL